MSDDDSTGERTAGSVVTETHADDRNDDTDRAVAELTARRLAVHDTVAALCDRLAAGDARDPDAALAAREAEELHARLRELAPTAGGDGDTSDGTRDTEHARRRRG